MKTLQIAHLKKLSFNVFFSPRRHRGDLIFLPIILRPTSENLQLDIEFFLAFGENLYVLLWAYDTRPVCGDVEKKRLSLVHPVCESLKKQAFSTSSAFGNIENKHTFSSLLLCVGR